MKRNMIVFLIIVCLSSLSAQIVLKSACDPWPPFVDPENPKEGLSLEITRAAFATQGYQVKHDYQPWARAMKNLKEGKIDIIVDTYINEERKKTLEFSDPYAKVEIKFIKLKNSDFEFNGLKSLDGKTIGVIRGYSYGQEFDKATNFKKQEVSNLYQNIKKLVAGRIDLTLECEIIARVGIAQKDAQLLEEISFTQNTLSSNDLYISSGKANPKHQEIIAAFNKGLKKIKENGTYAAIMKNYGIEL